jgi:hypothetical protein
MSSSLSEVAFLINVNLLAILTSCTMSYTFKLVIYLYLGMRLVHILLNFESNNFVIAILNSLIASEMSIINIRDELFNSLCLHFHFLTSLYLISYMFEVLIQEIKFEGINLILFPSILFIIL